MTEQDRITKGKITALGGFSWGQNVHVMGVNEGMEGCDWDGFMKTLPASDINGWT